MLTQDRHRARASDRLHITVDRETAERIRKAAADLGWSDSRMAAHILRQWYVRQLVQDAIDEQTGRDKPEADPPF